MAFLSINNFFLFFTQDKMRFFTSISIAALCFVASIQAAPEGLPVGGSSLKPVQDAVAQVAGNLPVPVPGLGGGQQPAGQSPGTGAATQQGGGGLTDGLTSGITGQ